jgi:hypothetical protein
MASYGSPKWLGEALERLSGPTALAGLLSKGRRRPRWAAIMGR